MLYYIYISIYRLVNICNTGFETCHRAMSSSHDIEVNTKRNDISDKLPLHENLTIEIGKLLYFQKPVLGNTSRLAQPDTNLPIQIIFPSGNFGIGIPLNQREELRANFRRSDVTAVMSISEDTEQDILYRRGIVFIFLAVVLVNFVITCLLYANVNVLDLSKVESYQGTENYYVCDHQHYIYRLWTESIFSIKLFSLNNNQLCLICFSYLFWSCQFYRCEILLRKSIKYKNIRTESILRIHDYNIANRSSRCFIGKPNAHFRVLLWTVDEFHSRNASLA